MTRNSAKVAFLVVTFLLAAAAATGGAVAAADPRGPESAPVATEAPTDTGVTEIAVSRQGNVIKAIGEPAGLTVAETDEAFFTITVEAVSVTQTCPGRGVPTAPERGYFVVLDVTASLAPDVRAVVDRQRDLFMPLGSEAFTLISPGGTSAAGSSAAAWGCHQLHELLPPFVEPGQRVSGKVVLDSATRSGRVVYAPQGARGWEWRFAG